MFLYEPTELRSASVSFDLTQSVAGKKRADLGISDNYAKACLEKLIGGGITSFSQLNAAEQCIRSLVFHEQIICLTPSVKINNMFNTPIQLCRSPVALTDYLGQDIIKSSIGNINYLHGFQRLEEAKKEIQKRETLRAKSKLHLPRQPIFSLSPNTTDLKHVADNIDDYAQNCFSTDKVLQSRYLLPIIKTKVPSYIAYPFLIENFEDNVIPPQANEFFNSLDDRWLVYQDKLKSRIDLAFPLFISIVLDRAEKREDIGKVIMELREEYCDCRNGLWNIYEQLDNENLSDSRYVQILIDVEESTKEIFNRSLLASSKSQLTLSLDNQKRLGSILTAGASLFDAGMTSIIATINAMLGGMTIGNTFDLKAAQITAQNIKDLNQLNLLTKFFTADELNALKE
ncbi:hypothetical protein [Thalassomonas sp. M1454]|uniref:hypothetical protein n=1 Tax=Thalassomonas sp. M1454 TaxID=2594477 RepID=UPI0011804ABC|nr:hypothetical protein [Thalassomonas sp. M1454]TRX57986.1 hypothetical protein FNN08_00950 [Thalassomonas sp. M1454]